MQSEGPTAIKGCVAFVHLPALVPDPFVNYPTLTSLGPLTVAGFLESRGVTVRFFEALTSDEQDGGKGGVRTGGRRTGNDVQPTIQPGAAGRVVGRGPNPETLDALCNGADLVVLPVDLFRDPTGWLADRVEQVAAQARRHEATVVVADCSVGGQDYVPLDPGLVLASVPSADLYLRGEAELGLLDLLVGRSPEDVAGCFSRRPIETVGRTDADDLQVVAGGAESVGLELVAGGGEAYGRELDSMDDGAEPAFHLLDLDRFFSVQRLAAAHDLIPDFHGTGAVLPVQSSRGCPFHCSFCAGLSKRFRTYSLQSMERLVHEWELLGADTLLFFDDVMNLDEDRFLALCGLLEARPHLTWTAVNGFRADRLGREAIRAFHGSGGFGLKVSAESGDDRVLADVIGKKMLVDASRAVARFAADESVPLLVHYVVGFPGEDAVAMNRTLLLAAELFEEQGASPRLQYATPIPGTRLFDQVRSMGLVDRAMSSADLVTWFVRGPILDLPDLPASIQRLAVDAFRLRVRQWSDPVLLLDPTFRCNQSCRFCAVERDRLEEPGEADIEQALVWAARRGVGRVDIGGGEPTLYPGLVGLVEQVLQLGMDPSLVTNGRRLAYSRYAEELVRAGLRRFVLSLSGHEADLHDAIARAPGAFDQAMAGLDNLVRLGWPAGAQLDGGPLDPERLGNGWPAGGRLADRSDGNRISLALNLNVCPANLRRLSAMVSFFAGRFPLDAINLQVVLPLGAGARPGEWFEDLDEVAEMVGEAADMAGTVPVTLHNLPPCFLPDRLALMLRDGYKGARFQWRSGLPVRFTEVTGTVLEYGDACASCPLRILCPGVHRQVLEQDDRLRQRVEVLVDAIRAGGATIDRALDVMRLGVDAVDGARDAMRSGGRKEGRSEEGGRS